MTVTRRTMSAVHVLRLRRLVTPTRQLTNPNQDQPGEARHPGTKDRRTISAWDASVME
jgi:hypothetical protein